MNLEQRPVVFEDIGRQVLATGHRHQPEYYYNKIGKLSDKVHLKTIMYLKR